ncbi:MAG: hypothetical protein DI536_29695 [Archangium gephyra]|uniref:Uncharacterized protein n=1 Tax=Archangium gephyra TaxID=48 RepID=A0A2W5SUV9_9BACT|nr:MAG: hypothetical protein DI536_29695 [Archangium gephyra]
MSAARRGLALVAAGFAVDAFAAVVFSFIGFGAQTLALPVTWLVASGLVTVGLVQLALTEASAELLWAAAALVAINASFDFATLALLRTDDVRLVSSPLMSLVSNVGLFSSLLERAAVAWVLFRLANHRSAWALLFAVATFGAVLVRTAYGAALAWGLISTDWVSATVMSSTSLVSAGSALALALWARSNARELTVPGVPPREQGLHAPTAAADRVNPASDFLVGGGMLLIGVVMTTVTVSSASNGGRYIVATGAMTVGVARLIRGVLRLTGK